MSFAMWRELSRGGIHFDVAILAGDYLLCLILSLLCIAYSIVGFGLWNLNNWAHKTLLAVNLIGMAVSVISVAFLVKPGILAIALVISPVIVVAWIVGYLMRPRVRFAFEAWPLSNSDTSTSAPLPGPSKAEKAWVSAGIVATFAIFGSTLFVGIESAIRSSSVYHAALGEAQHSPCVAAGLGVPLTDRWGVTGGMSESAETGSANLDIPIRGPKGEGHLEMLAEKQNGAWEIRSLILIEKSGQIRLIPAASAPGCQ